MVASLYAQRSGFPWLALHFTSKPTALSARHSEHGAWGGLHRALRGGAHTLMDHRPMHSGGVEVARRALRSVCVLGLLLGGAVVQGAEAEAALPAAVRGATGWEVQRAEAHAAGSGCRITDEEVEYTLRRLANATVSLEPYPHMYVEQVFEPRLYECMLKSIPRSNKAYQQLFGKVGRYSLNLRDDHVVGPSHGVSPLVVKPKVPACE